MHRRSLFYIYIGYIAGLITYKFQTYSGDALWTDCAKYTSEGGVSITSLWASCPTESMHIELLPNARVNYILIIEKEGIFKRLCEDNFHLRMGCIMVTGCGFPDISTRACVANIIRVFPVSDSNTLFQHTLSAYSLPTVALDRLGSVRL